MRQEPYTLSTPQARKVVRQAIIEVCQFRRWPLLALHVRTTHVHGVVDTPDPVSKVLNAWKAYATRALRSAGLESADRIIWAHGGNSSPITSEERIGAAVRYVLDGQGEMMERFCGE